jgi:FkbM family methyltransferase
MDDLIVFHKGFWWTRDDGGGVTETEASPSSCCYDLTTNQPNEPYKISALVPTRGIAIQAGGNVGFFTKQYAAIFQTVYTFEPIPVLFHCLNRNVQNENVFKFQACLGKERGCVSLGRKAVNNAGSQNVVGEGTTPILRIDDLGLPRCDLIQLDLEGYEFYALQGGVETIKKYNPVIVIEVYWSTRYGHSLDEIESWLSKLNYVCTGTMDANKIYTYSRYYNKHHSVFTALKL